MSKTRTKLSNKSTYYIEKFRFLELQNFCRQYPIWQQAYQSLSELSHKPQSLDIFRTTGLCTDPTANCALARVYYQERIKMLERVATATDECLAPYILEGVTKGVSYDVLKANFNIPCCRNAYYNLYRRFFWLLNKERN